MTASPDDPIPQGLDLVLFGLQFTPPVTCTTARVLPPSPRTGGWFRVFPMTSAAGSLRRSRPASPSPLVSSAAYTMVYYVTMLYNLYYVL